MYFCKKWIYKTIIVFPQKLSVHSQWRHSTDLPLYTITYMSSSIYHYTACFKNYNIILLFLQGIPHVIYYRLLGKEIHSL